MAGAILRHGMRQPQLRSFFINVGCKVPSRGRELAIEKNSLVRFASSQTNDDTPKPVFIPVYRLPYIVALKTVCRAKIYQTALTVIGAGVCTGLIQTGVVSPIFAATLVGLGSVAIGALVIMGEFFRRVIGLVYLSEDKRTVKFSHLGFWGNRIDVSVPIEDIVRLPDTEERAGDAYVKIRRYSTDKTLFLSIRYGKIVEEKLFKETFGDPDLYK